MATRQMKEMLDINTFHCRTSLSVREMVNGPDDLEGFIRRDMSHQLANHILDKARLVKATPHEGHVQYDMDLFVARPEEVIKMIVDAAKELRALYDTNGHIYNYTFEENNR